MVVGLLLRNLALYTARSNFNHLVQTTKAPSHRLVTHGVYAYACSPIAPQERAFALKGSGPGGRWTRHPSYAGFFWYSLGTQVLLANPLTLVVYVGALYAFFIPRIQYPPLAAHPPWHACFTGRSPLTTRALGLVGGGTEEEAYLVEFFGDAYRAFQRTVPTLIPFVK